MGGKKRLRNRFTVLLAEKAYREGRASIPRREVVEKTGLVKTTVDRIANNDVSMYDNRVVLLICEYLGCTPGDLLVIEDIEDPERKTPRLASLAATAVVGR